MNDKPPLRPYQAAGVRFLQDHPRAYLADDPGLGKSRQLLEASVGRTLILAPAMILDSGTWAHEVNRWTDDPERFTYVPYTSLCDRQRIPGVPVYERRKGGKTIQVSNDEDIRDPFGELYPDLTPCLDAKGNQKITRARSAVLPRPRPEYRHHWDTIICDEAQMLKGRKTTWVEALKVLSAMTDRLYLASGTPISHFAPDLFSPLQLLYPEKSRKGGEFGSYWRWIGQWFDTNPSYFNDKAKVIGGLRACYPECLERPVSDPCEHYQRFFHDNLGGRYIQRLRDDVLTDLPPMDMQTVLTPMTPKQAAAYAAMKKECLATTLDGRMAVAWSKSSSHVKLDRIATGLGTLTGSPQESGKMERLRYDLANRAHPTLVVAHYRDTVAAAAAVAGEVGARTAVIDGGTSKENRLRHVQDFQAGTLDVLVGSLETISEGLTLTAADMVIFVEQSWKPSRNQQALRRVHRLGQTRPVTAVDYLTPGTVDEGKRVLLDIKEDRQLRTLTWGVVKSIL